MTFEEAYEFVRKRFEGENRSVYHDFTHVMRVLKYGEEIMKAEGGDPEVIRYACLFHDIVRPDEDVNRNHHELSARESEKLLGKYVSDKSVPKIIACIEAHSSCSKRTPETLEEKIIYDADKLDGFGYPVIMRIAIGHGGLHGGVYRDMYAAVEDYLQATKEILKRGFYTKTAQKIAEQKAKEAFEVCERILAEK